LTHNNGKTSVTNTPHDQLVKKVLENPIAARELMEEYLPASFKQLVDLSTIKVEKESFIEEHLTKRLSDLVLSVKTKDNEKAFVYSVIEHQSSSDYFISFRLLKYSLLLLERHIDKQAKNKLPLICPLVIYHGARKYQAPRNFWQLFSHPELAKEFIAGNYNLLDLNSMQDNDINYEKHLSIILYMLKHVHQRDKLKLIEDIFKNCQPAILIDKKQDFIYTKLILWYCDSKISADKKQEVRKIILDNLPNEKDGVNVMKSIADTYIEEGEARGEEKGKAKGIEQTAINMLKQKADIKFISSVTGLSIELLLKLKNKIHISN